MESAARLIRPELLDDSDPARARASLRDLVKINRYLGGYSTLRNLMTRYVTPHDRFTILDIGGASGDMGAKLRSWYPGACVTVLDYRDTHLVEAAPPKL